MFILFKRKKIIKREYIVHHTTLIAHQPTGSQSGDGRRHFAVIFTRTENIPTFGRNKKGLGRADINL